MPMIVGAPVRLIRKEVNEVVKTLMRKKEVQGNEVKKLRKLKNVKETEVVAIKGVGVGNANDGKEREIEIIEEIETIKTGRWREIKKRKEIVLEEETVEEIDGVLIHHKGLYFWRGKEKTMEVGIVMEKVVNLWWIIRILFRFILICYYILLFNKIIWNKCFFISSVCVSICVFSLWRSWGTHLRVPGMICA